MANRRDLVARFAERIQFIARRRNSGYPLSEDELTAIDLSGLLIWDDEMDFFDRSIRTVGLKFQ